MESEELLAKISDSKEAKPTIPVFIKSEVNFVRLPFFSLSRKDSSKRIEAEYRESVERDGKKIEILWTVTANAKFGYPTPFDKKVHKAIESLISRKSFPITNPVDFSLYEICRLMNVKADSGRNYEMVKNSLLRTTFAGIQSKGTFYSKNDRRWIEDAFHLYDRIVFIGETLPSGQTAETNYLFLGDWYLKSLNSFYVKPLDYSFFLNLKSSVAGRLYEFLSLQFYATRGRPYIIDYKKLCQVLPVNEQRYLSKAIQNLESAHKELISKMLFLSKVEWQDQTERKIIYYPGRKSEEELKSNEIGRQFEFELPPHNNGEIEGKTELPTDLLNVVEQLTQRGITQITARKLAKDYTTNQIQEQITVFDWLVERKSPLVQKNPAGFLRKSIEENYEPPKDFANIQIKRVKEQKESERKERWLKHREELIKQDIANWDETLPEDRIKGRLGFWIAGENINGRQPNPGQVERKRRELIASLPKTDEEKWEHIARNYPEDPPEDFE